MLEPDKGKYARLLTEHLTGQRLLPSTEVELQQQLKKRAQRDLKNHRATAEEIANRQAPKGELAAHEARMAAHLAAKAREETLTAVATET